MGEGWDPNEVIPEDVAAVPDEAPTPTVTASSPGDVAHVPHQGGHGRTMAPNMTSATEGTPRRPFNNASQPDVAVLKVTFENAGKKVVTKTVVHHGPLWCVQRQGGRGREDHVQLGAYHNKARNNHQTPLVEGRWRYNVPDLAH